MNNEPLVSIIALCYNHTKYCVDTLNSIINQSYKNIELIIIDDCSKDNSVEVISNWIKKNNVKCTFIKHQFNMGLVPTVNEGLNIAKGKYFQEVACDDILLENKVEIQIKRLLKENEEVAVIFSDAYLIDDEGKTKKGMFIDLQQKFDKIPSVNIYEALLNKNFIPAMSVLTNTNYFKKLGGYDESLLYEDYDKWLRLAKEYKIIYSEYPSAKYRIHANNLHKSLDFNTQIFYIYTKHSKHPIAQKKMQSIVMYLYKHKNLTLDIKKKFAKLCNNNKLLKFCINLNLPYSFFINLSKITNKIS